jgi:hypothetical protein
MILLLAFLALTAVIPTCNCWTIPVTADLAWPVIENAAYITQNGTLVGPDPDFPCVGYKPQQPEQAGRIGFPIIGGRLQINLTNSSSAGEEYAGYYYIVNSYLGQISLPGVENDDDTLFAYDNTEVWQNIVTGPNCSYKINATELIGKALQKNLNDQDIVGTNATFGLRTVFFNPDGDNVEEMLQV